MERGCDIPMILRVRRRCALVRYFSIWSFGDDDDDDDGDTDAHIARRLAMTLRICRRDKNMLPPPTSRREETSTNLFLLLFLLLDDTNKYSAVTKLVVFVVV